ncbi:MAG: hypothetical protein COB02_10885 [Candidatus Cloacimonadota bacterium]|nr:MAG: hypothetical protein COB02_10885 [Candidatus Cloacimonadota bacterium]
MKKLALFALITGHFFADTHTDKLETRIKLLEQGLNALKTELKLVIEAEKSKPKLSNPSKGLIIKKPNTKQYIKVGGRMMIDYSFLSADQGLINKFNPNLKNSSEFRRARIHIAGATNDKISYKLSYEFSKANATIKDTFIKYKSNSQKGLRIGHTVEPFGLEYMNSSKYITFMERSVIDAFYPKYNSGIFYMDEDPKKKFTWALGLFGDAGSDGKTGLVGKSVWNTTARFIYDPYYKNNGKHYLHLGFAQSHRNSNGNSISFSITPGSHLWNKKFNTTGNISANSTDLYGLEFLWNKDKLSVQSEYVKSEVNAVNGLDSEFSGWYVFASYFLTNDHRPYNRKYRLSSRVKPNSDYTKGGRGAWQIAARYSTLDLNDTSAKVFGGKVNSQTFGLNWHLTSNTRVMWNYVLSDHQTLGDSKSFNMRLQIDF